MTTKDEMIEVPVEHLLEEAQKKADEMGHLYFSMRGPQAAQVGALGELVGMEHLTRCKIPYEEVFSIEYDVKFPAFGKENTLEFKTKERTVAPQEHYDCTAPLYNQDVQRPDYYMFISLLSTGKSDDINRFKKAYILGTIDKESFSHKSQLWTRDQMDSTNGWVPTYDCLNITISDLHPPQKY
jgi:hypothetical protein